MTREQGAEKDKSGPLNYKEDIIPHLNIPDPKIPVAQLEQFFELQRRIPQVYQESDGTFRIVYSGNNESIMREPIEKWKISIVRLKDGDYQFPNPMLKSPVDD